MADRQRVRLEERDELAFDHLGWGQAGAVVGDKGLFWDSDFNGGLAVLLVAGQCGVD
jgi:hypothetical protein